MSEIEFYVPPDCDLLVPEANDEDTRCVVSFEGGFIRPAEAQVFERTEDREFVREPDDCTFVRVDDVPWT